MENPRTSIVVLAHNSIDMSKKFLEALYSNTNNFYLILIDNASNDGSVEYFLSFYENHKDNMTFVKNEINNGVIGGRNQGYELYKKMAKDVAGDFLVFLDNDQICQKGWLESHHFFMQEGKYDIIGVEAWLLNSSFWPIRNCKKPGEPFTYVGCGGMMMKREVPEKIGMFDEIFSPCYFEDPDFCIRAIKNGFNIGWNYFAKILHIPHQTLGKINSQKRNFFLKKSHDNFKKKWHNTKLRSLYQTKIDFINK